MVKKNEKIKKEDFNTISIKVSKPRVVISIKISAHFEKEKLNELILLLQKDFAPQKGFKGLVIFSKSLEELKNYLISKEGLVINRISSERASDIWIAVKEFAHKEFLEIKITA